MTDENKSFDEQDRRDESETQANASEAASILETSDSEPDVEVSPSKVGVTLRWWPAALLLVAMPLVRMLPSFAEAPGVLLITLGFLGPALLGGLLLLWWCFASRAGIGEKLIGLASVLLIGGVSVGLLHYSLQGIFAVILVIPTGLAAFALGLVVFARSRRLRVPVALLMSIIGFGYWDLQQNEGTTGDFQTQLAWRWELNAEQRYLDELERRERVDPSVGDDAPVTLASAQWPAFRGAERSGVVTGLSLATDWQSRKPVEIWKHKIGPGWSSFSVAGDRLFTQEQRDQQEAVVCLHADTGDLIWDLTYPSRFWEAIAGAGPRATPTIADEGLFALGAEGILLRLNAATGEEIWRRDLKEDADRKPPTWGFSASPLVVDSLVIVHAGGSDDKGLFAYDVETGEIAWSVASGNHSYSSPQLNTLFDQQGILMLTNDGLQFLRIDNGESIWQHDWSMENYRTLQPLVVDNSIFITSSIQEGTRRITVSCSDGEAWDVSEDWTSQAMKSDYNDYVYYQGMIYGFDRGIFACVDAESGERMWKRGRYGNGQVVLLKDSGQLLVVTEKGEIVLIDASPDKLIETDKFQAIEGKTWNHPVLVGNRLYVRNAQEVACYELPVAD